MNREEYWTWNRFGEIVFRTVIEDGCHRVPVLTAVLPQINAAIGDHAAWMGISAEPVNGIDLVHQPLIRDSGGVRPEQAELKVLACIERLVWKIHQIALPVRVFFLQQRYDIWPSPAPRLIDVPGHLNHHDVAELTRLNVLVRLLIARRAASLGPNLHNLLTALWTASRMARAFSIVWAIGFST